MYRNELFVLKYLSEIPYLLPVGQAAADMRRSVCLNSTGALIWEFLSNGRSTNSLLSECAKYFEITQDENDSAYIGFKNDILEFVNTLLSEGLIYDDSADFRHDTGMMPDDTDFSSMPSGSKLSADSDTASLNASAKPDDASLLLSIGGFIVGLQGNAAHFPSEFDSFVCPSTGAPSDINISLITAFPDEIHEIPHINRGVCMCPECRKKMPVKKITGSKNLPVVNKSTPLLNHPDLTVFKNSTGYSLYFNSMPAIIRMDINNDASDVRIWLEKDFSDSARMMLFHAIRMPFVFFALSRGCIMLHSASILYRDRIWLFSGPSGTGKSTHTDLWNKIFGTPVINGDLNLIVPSKQDILVCGTPWCGTSGICDNLTHTLGGIIFLKQAPADYCEKLTETEKRLNLLQRLISPRWTGEMLDNALNAAELTADRVMMCRLCCTPKESAARTMKSEIDSRIS